ncbi:PAS domain S-box protein [bacterium]|nr:MAG: PAS domain S-box protein [bacterium]
MQDNLKDKLRVSDNFADYPGTSGIDLKLGDALLRGAEHYQDLVENAKSIILEMDKEGRVIFWNKFAAEFFGYTSQEIAGKSVVGTIVPEKETGGRDLRQLIEDICKNPHDYANNVNENIKKNGERVWIVWTNHLVKDSNGQVKGVLCIGNDITMRKVLEEKLRQARDELEIRVKVRTAELARANEELRCDIRERKRVEKERDRFFAMSIDMLCIIGFDGYIKRLNPAFERILGFSKEELLAHPLVDFVHPDDRLATTVEMEKLSGGTPTVYFENRLRCKDGSYKWLSWTSAPYVSEGMLYTVARDITERKLVEDSLRQGERFLNSIFSSIQDGVSILDCDMNIIQVNPTMEHWYAHAMPLIGKKCYQAYHGSQTFCQVCPSLKTRDTGKSFHEVIPKRDSTWKIVGWFDLYSFPLTDINSGEMKGMIEYVRDVTEQKKAEERLAKINECFLSFGINGEENINQIVSLCGQLLDADCALYNRLDHGLLCAAGSWNLPSNFKKSDHPQGHICYDLIKQGVEDALVVRNLQESSYAQTDPNVSQYNLKTYLGYPVKFGGEYIGSLCAVYQRDIIPDEGDKRLIGILASIIGTEEERRSAQEALKYRLEFEKLITDISTNFINIPLDKIESGINYALKLIGEFVGASRSYIFLLRANAKHMDNTYEWCAVGVDSQIDRLQGVRLSDFHWFMGKIKNFEAVYIPRVSDLPPEAKAEKEEFELEKTETLLCVPIVYDGKLLGFVGFDSVLKEMDWSKDTIALLKISGEIFANTLRRKLTSLKLEELNKELIASNKVLKQLALRDQQTGLYNHRYLSEVIVAEFHRARRYAHPLSAMMLDVDYFKSINDVYGHQFGDLVIQQLAKQLKRMVRQYDIVIRFGGEEFVIVSPGTDRTAALTLAQRILDAINLYNFGNKKHLIKLKLSIAVASYPEDNVLKGIDLIGLTDRILSKVKESGGNSISSSLDISKKEKLTKRKDSVESKFLKEKIEKLTRRANQSLVEAVFAFAKTIELKDRYTGEHVERTVYYATEIAKAMNLSKEETERIRQAAILHDLGKIGISEKILLKKSKLTKKEFAEIKKHPQIGVDIIRPIQFLHAIIPFILYHHERWDGKGYPNGLKGEEIPFGARIIAIADVYQALISDRPYRKAYPKDKVMKIIKDAAGSQFDPKIVSWFLKII